MAGPSTSDLPGAVGTSLPPVYQFHVSFTGPYENIWRRIQVPMDYNYYALHTAIQDAFGWNDIHPYCFRLFWRLPPVAPITLPATYDGDYLINVKFQSKGDKCTYTYGQPVVILLVLLEDIVDRSDEDACYPKCLGGRRGLKPETRLDWLPYPNNPNYIRFARSSLEYTEAFNRESVVFKDPRQHFQNRLPNPSPSTTS